jgi:hypothetical protein
VVRQGAPRGGHRGGQGGDHPGGPADLDAAAAPGVRRRDGRAVARAALPRPVRALRRGRRGATSAPGTWCSGWWPCWAAWSRPRRTWPSGPPRRRCGSAGRRRRRVVVRGDSTDLADLYTKLARAAPRCPATRSSASSPAAAASRCTAPTAPTPRT